ncbi:MAG: peptidoglycan-associated lipoprotein Pal [Acidobacteriia bacterium]|nr:peptidoglycan-associated lipoprotein Pal [Terriglobia bacterium]
MKWLFLVASFAVLMTVSGCKKKETPPPPPPPPPPAPTASLTANPSAIERGQSTTLTWQTQNATDVSIGGLGTVEPSGSRQVSPSDSTTFRLTAKGPGGTQDATARVTVSVPPPPAVVGATDEELFAQNVKDAFFDYDKYDIRPDAQQALQAGAQFLAQHPNIRFTIEGHCDERGSTEYNLGLGDNRANAAKNFLAQAGVSADRIKTISYGKEKPVCTESNETCWQRNRRAHFVYQR